MLRQIDHIGVAVEDIDAALDLYTGPLAMPLEHRETVDEQGVEAALVGVGAGHVELPARVDPDELKKLRRALESGGWHELEAEDGTVALNLAQVVYVNVDSDEHRVGFGT